MYVIYVRPESMCINLNDLYNKGNKSKTTKEERKSELSKFT